MKDRLLKEKIHIQKYILYFKCLQNKLME